MKTTILSILILILFVLSAFYIKSQSDRKEQYYKCLENAFTDSECENCALIHGYDIM